MFRKSLLKQFLPLILSTLSFHNAILSQSIKQNIFENTFLDPTTSEIYQEKVKNAIKKFLESQTFVFFNIDSFENLQELNSGVLPILLQKLSLTSLVDNHDDLIYDSKDLSINKYLKITGNQLLIELKYLSKIFSVNLNLITKIDDNILAQAIKTLFDKITFKNKDLPTFFEWEKIIDTFNKSKEWINQTLQNQPLKINNMFTMINHKKFNAFLIDLDQWKEMHKIFLTYTFGDSEVFTLQVPINKLITKLEISNAIQNTINQSQSDFLLDKNISYKNFNQFTYEKKWKKQIETFFLINPLIIGNKKIDVKEKDIIVSFDKNLQTNPWTSRFKINCIYKIGEIDINFYLPIAFDNEIDYELITSSFINDLKDMKINGIHLKDQNIDDIKSYLINEIKFFFNKKIIIETKEYDLVIDDLEIKDYNFFYKNDQGKILINLMSLALNKNAFNIEIDILQYEGFFSQIIFDFLQKITKQNRFDVANEINENNSWFDVINKINEKMSKIIKLDQSILQKIEWEAFYGDGESLKSKLSDDGVKNSTDFKNIKLDIFGIKIPRYTLWIKNIFLSDQFKVNHVAKNFSLTQNTKLLNIWPYWSVKQKVSAEEIGINLPQNLYDVTINYFIDDVNADLGYIIVNLDIKKNQAIKTIKIKIEQFTSSKHLSNKIKNFFEKDFDAKMLNLSSQNTHYEAYKKAINYLQQIVGQNSNAIQEITVINPDQRLQSSIFDEIQVVKFMIKIGNLNTLIYFWLININ